MSIPLPIPVIRLAEAMTSVSVAERTNPMIPKTLIFDQGRLVLYPSDDFIYGLYAVPTQAVQVYDPDGLRIRATDQSSTTSEYRPVVSARPNSYSINIGGRTYLFNSLDFINGLATGYRLAGLAVPNLIVEQNGKRFGIAY